MSANKSYYPAYVGGKIKAVSISIQNTTGSDISLLDQNGVYYTFEGNDFQLLSCRDQTAAAGETIQWTEQLYDAPVPTSDIKLMVDTAGMAGCIVNVQILWEVDE